jgi:hypothetical protein
LTLHEPAHVTWHVAAPVQSIVELSPALTTHSWLFEQS